MLKIFFFFCLNLYKNKFFKYYETGTDEKKIYNSVLEAFKAFFLIHYKNRLVLQVCR